MTTVQEVTAAIDEMGRRAFAEAISPEWWGENAGKSEPVSLGEIGVATYLESKEGAEGEGEHIYVVFSVGDELFQMNGYYNSWDGSDWSYGDIFRVKAQTISKVIYIPESV